MLPVSHSGPHFLQRPWSAVPVLLLVLDHHWISLMFLFWVSLYISFSWSGSFPSEFSLSLIIRQFHGLSPQSKAIHLTGVHCKHLHFFLHFMSRLFPIVLTIVNRYDMHMEMFLSHWASGSRAQERGEELGTCFWNVILHFWLTSSLKRNLLTFLHWWRENEMKSITVLAK